MQQKKDSSTELPKQMELEYQEKRTESKAKQ